MLNLARRAAVLTLVLAFSAGHAGLCAAAAVVLPDAGNGAPASCPLHQSAPRTTVLAQEGRSAAMTCCEPAERQETSSVAPIVTSVISTEPAEHHAGIVLPALPPRLRTSHARDSAPPKSVATHLLLSVFIV